MKFQKKLVCQELKPVMPTPHWGRRRRRGRFLCVLATFLARGLTQNAAHCWAVTYLSQWCAFYLILHLISWCCVRPGRTRSHQGSCQLLVCIFLMEGNAGLQVGLGPSSWPWYSHHTLPSYHVKFTVCWHKARGDGLIQHSCLILWRNIL